MAGNELVRSGATGQLAAEAERSVHDALCLLTVAHQTNDLDALGAAARATDILQRAHAVTGGLRVLAERRAGELLHELNPDEATTTRLGIDKHRRQRFEQLAIVFANDSDAYEHLAVMLSNGKDVSPNEARKLAPRSTKPERASYINGQYVAPSITIEVAMGLAGDLGDEFGEFVLHSINDAIRELPERQARVWLMRHGITDDGTQGDTWSFDAIGKHWGKTREYAQTLYWQADRQIARCGWRDALHGLKHQLTS